MPSALSSINVFVGVALAVWTVAQSKERTLVLQGRVVCHVPCGRSAPDVDALQKGVAFAEFVATCRNFAGALLTSSECAANAEGDFK
jgi:hypothetical protein